MKKTVCFRGTHRLCFWTQRLLPAIFCGNESLLFGNGFMKTAPNSGNRSAGPVNASSESAFESAVPHYIHEKTNLCRFLEDFQFIFIAISSEVWYTGENPRKK